MIFFGSIVVFLHVVALVSPSTYSQSHAFNNHERIFHFNLFIIYHEFTNTLHCLILFLLLSDYLAQSNKNIKKKKLITIETSEVSK